MRLHSTCPSCQCGDEIQAWLHASLIPAEGDSTSTYDIWAAFLRSHEFQLSLHTYQQRYLTKIISWTDTPDGAGIYQVIKGRLHGWKLRPELERP